jgi:hypothetical protein
MQALVGRELIAIARMPAFWTAGTAYALALAAFVIIWGDGLPIHGGRPPFQQFLAAQALALSAVLPWTAMRCAAPAGRQGIAALAVAAASRVWRIVMARWVALTVALTLLGALALPLTVVMQQIAARPFAASLLTLLPVIGLSAFAAAAATASALAIADRVGAWMAATAVTMAATMMVVW